MVYNESKEAKRKNSISIYKITEEIFAFTCIHTKLVWTQSKYLVEKGKSYLMGARLFTPRAFSTSAICVQIKDSNSVEVKSYVQTIDLVPLNKSITGIYER